MRNCDATPFAADRSYGRIFAAKGIGKIAKQSFRYSFVPPIFQIPGVFDERHLRQKNLVWHEATVRLHGLGDLQIVHGQHAPEQDLHLIHVEFRRALHAQEVRHTAQAGCAALRGTTAP